MADASAALIAAEAAKRTAQLTLLGTGLTSLVSLVIAILAQLSTRRNQREMKVLEHRNNTELARINALFAERKSELDARRDYDYEARKRLYNECEPLLFRLAEASENALHRIYSLARTARQGDLGPERPNWLADGYYMVSTLYNLLASLVVFRLLQDRLTFVDLNVDRRIGGQYLLGKQLYITFTDDFEVAGTEPILDYSPFVENWYDRRNDQPERYWRQGVPIGRLDAALELMIVRQHDNPSRCMTFGEFEPLFREDRQRQDSRLEIFADILTRFHPQSRPILWRILVIQAVLHCALIRGFQQRDTTEGPALITSIGHVDQARLDWRQPGRPEDERLVSEPLSVARTYLEKRLSSEMWQSCLGTV